MRICKLFLLLLLFLFVFTACQSAEQPTPIPDASVAQPEPVPEEPAPIVEEPEPVPEEPAPIVEEPEPIPLPDPAAIEAKTQQASICPCLAVEHAQWNLARHGFSDYTGEPLNSVLAAFSAHVTENWESLTQTYGDLVNGTLWIIDHDENGYYLQIIRFTDTAEQLLMLQWDGAEMTVFEESRPMEKIEYAVCSKYCDPELLQPRREHLGYDGALLFHRFSSIDNGRYVYAGFYAVADDSTLVTIRMDNPNPWAYTTDERSLYPQKQEPIVSISPVVERLLRLDYSGLEYPMGTEDRTRVLLQDHLFRITSSPETRALWDAPGYASEENEQLTWMRNHIEVFVRELDQDPELKAQLLGMDTWEITGNMVIYSISGVTEQGRRLTVTMNSIVMDSEDWITPSRKRVQRLAEAGENSEAVPDHVKSDVVDYIMKEELHSLPLIGDHEEDCYTWVASEDGIYRVTLLNFHPDETSGVTYRHWYRLRWENGTVTLEATD